MIDYSIVGGQSTYISSLDVRVLGVAGGSMVRANRNEIIDVGPRSAHIAGLNYAVYTETQKITGPKVELFSPKPGDPADYVRIVLENGEAVTLTNSCGANVLGLIKPGHFSYGNIAAAKLAMEALANYCQTSFADIATQIMEKSYQKIQPVIQGLIEKYKLEKDQISLVGVGGGAASLIVFYSQKDQIKYDILENAEIISSIGVALAMVRDVVERMISNPTPEEMKAIKQEALDKAVSSGANPETVEVHIEIDSQMSKVTAIATGSTEVKSMDLLKECTEVEAKTLAAKDMRLKSESISLLAQSPYFYVFCNHRAEDLGQIRILDKKGFIKVQRANALMIKTIISNYLDGAKKLWEALSVYQSEIIVRPDFYVCLGARVLYFTASSFEHLTLLIGVELSDVDESGEVILVAANIRQT